VRAINTMRGWNPFVLIGIGLASLGACASRGPSDALGQVSDPKREPAEVSAVDVQFLHGGNVLSGTLFCPHAPGPHPAIALVLGSGKQDREYAGDGTVLGKHFARNGFACLTWDKPGCGRSTGDFNEQTIQDRAEEALMAVRFLRARDDIRPECVGLWGHSQGGMVVPLAAANSRDVAFLIEVGGWQGPAWQQDVVRVEAELRANGFPESSVARATAFARRRMDLIRGAGPFEDLDQAQEAVKAEPWFEHVHRCDRTLFDSARRSVEFDSAPSWEKVRCQVLVIFGANDTSSGAAGPLVDIIRRGLAKAGNRNITVKIFPDADHSLHRCPTGDRTEVVQSTETSKNKNGSNFVAGYLDTMTDWLTAIMGKAAP
jgi:pimeloyl-ACP methyl ester carboxylesterase